MKRGLVVFLFVFLFSMGLVCAENFCVDTDSGVNYYLRGVCVDGVLTEEISEGCIEGGSHEGWLREASCENDLCVLRDYECPYGCEEGACLPGPTVFDCIDSDGGKDVYNKGNTIGKKWGTGQYVYDSSRERIWSDAEEVNFTDYCIVEGEKAGRLVEYFCFGGAVVSQSYGPEDGCDICQEGKCIDSIPFPNCEKNQCERNKKCYNIGERMGGSVENIRYCDGQDCEVVEKKLDYSFGEYCTEEGIKSLKMEGENCSDNFECVSNICFEGECIAEHEDMTEKVNIWKGIFKWLKSVFN